LTWAVLGAFGDPNNWYNDNIYALGWEDGWSGNSGGWLLAQNQEPSLSGVSDLRLRVAFSSDGSGTYEGFAFDDFGILEVACSDPSAVTATNITINAADLDWVENGTSSAWEIEYGEEGFALGTGTTVSVSTTPEYAFTSLDPNTSYDVYVRADCGATGFSGYEGPVTFTTDYCAAPIAAFPYSEDFESGAGGWVDNGSNVAGTWELGVPNQVYISTANSPVNAMMTRLNSSYPNNAQLYMENCFDLSGVTAPVIELAVNYFSENTWDGTNVQVSTDGGLTWAVLGAFGDPNNWYNDNIYALGWEDGWSGNSGGWLNTRHEMDAYAGEADVRVRVAFGSDASASYEGFAFDDVALLDETCPTPTNVVLGNETVTSFDVTFDPATVGSVAYVEYGPVGFALGTGTTTAGTITAGAPVLITVSGLTAGTIYDVYVYEDCEPINMSGPDLSASIANATYTLGNPSACDLGIPIPDNNAGTAELIMPVSVVGTSLGFDVELKEVRTIISHTWDADVTASLVDPTGLITVELTSGNGSLGDNYGEINGVCDNYTTFSMTAGASITTGSAPFIGSYIPEGDFADFNDLADPNGNWKLIVTDGGFGDVGHIEFCELVFGDPPGCPSSPTAVATSNNTSTSFDVNFTTGNAIGTSYYVEYGAPGFVQGTGTVIGSVGNNLVGPGPVTVNVSGLVGSTAYDVYVWENCGTIFDSNVIGPNAGYTLGNPSACGLNLEINNSIAPTEIILPVTGYPGEIVGLDQVVGEAKVLIAHSWDDDMNIELESPDGVVVMLSERNGSLGDNFGDPSVPGCGITANFRDDATTPIGSGAPPFTAEAAYIPDAPMSGFNGLTNTVDGDWILRVTDFVNGDDGTLEFAEIVFELPPPCQDPQTLALTSTTTAGADFSFFSWNDGDAYTLEYGPVGYTAGSGTVGATGTSVLGGGNSASIIGLPPGTIYEAYIMQTCGGDVSNFVGPVEFATRPLNDECAGGIVLPVSPTGFCTSYETSSNIGATPLVASGVNDPSCSFYDGGDVWFKAVVPVTGNVTVSSYYSSPIGVTDIGVAAYDVCSGVQLGCDDDGGIGGMSELALTGLTFGDTIYIRVWEYGNNAMGEFDVCAFEPTTTAPGNNLPCAAWTLPVGNDCNYSIVTNAYATTDIEGSCTAGERDVWWKATVPASGALVVNTLSFTMTDATMTAHTITDCSDQATWTEIDCADDEGDGLMPYMYLDATDGVSPGDEVYLRVAGWGSSDEGTFRICASRGVVWTGAANSQYSNEDNWMYGSGFGNPGPPSINEHVIISPNATNPAVVNTGGSFANNVWINSGASLSVDAGQTLNIAGDLDINNPNGNQFGVGTVAMNSVVNSQTITNAFGSIEFGELLIDNTSGVTVNQIYAGANMKINEVLDVNSGDFNTGGTSVTLISDASGTAYLDDWNGAVTSGTVTGALTVERYVASPGYHHISSPVNTPDINSQYSEYGPISGVNGVGVTPIGSAGAACADTTLEAGSNYGPIFEWQENSPGFNNDFCSLWGWHVRSSGNFENARGYAAQSTATGPFTLRVTGTVHSSPVSNAGLTNSGGDGNGFHLVGNPFAAPITWNNPGGFANFAYAWNDGSGTYSSYFSGTTQFAAHQGFFINSTGTSTFSVDNTSKFEGDPGFLRTGSVFGDYSLQLDVAGNGFTHFSVIAFADVLGGSSCTNGWDVMCDAYALPGNSGQPFMFSMTTEDEIASPNRLQYNTQTLLDVATRSVPVGLNPGANGTFTISATDLESFPSGTGIVLEDTKEGIMHDLNSNPVYTFTSVTSDFDPNNPTSRFVVHFSPASVTDIANVIDINAGFYTMGDQLIMQMNILESVEGMFSVLNAVGQDVMSSDNITTINGKHAEDVGELANGVYIVRFVTEGKTFSGKFVKH
jgi:subtilisin-like proprotein convertase family protein